MKATVLDPMPFRRARTDASGPEIAERMTSCDLETLFVEHADFVFRTCRHLGLDRAAAEDATQQVFLIAARKSAVIPEGKERAFLFVTARNIVSNAQRTIVRRREDFAEVDVVDESQGPDQLLDQARARAIAERVLDGMELDLRVAFVLFEVEQLTFTEIAELLGIPRGTVASRVRRARDEFELRVKRTLGKASRSRGIP